MRFATALLLSVLSLAAVSPDQTAPNDDSPAGPSMKETEAWIKRQLPVMIKDRVVTKTSTATWAITYSVEKIAISDCRLVLRTAEDHESPPDWQPSRGLPAIRTITLGDIDVSKITVREYPTASETTLSKPTYLVTVFARSDRGKPFTLEHHGQPPRSVASIGLRISAEGMGHELASKLRHAALLCGAPDAPPATATVAAPVAPSTAAVAAVVSSNATSTTIAKPQPVPANAMTNADVILMATAGLSDDVISTAIRQAPSKAFDLTPTALITLKTKKVSDNVIAAMQAAANPAPPAPTAAQPRPKYDASLAETAKAPAAPQPCAGVEMMGLYKNEVYDRAMGGGVVEWLAKIRNNTAVTKIVVFGWIDSYGQQKRSQVELGAGQIASPRVDLTQARYVAPVRDLRLLSCQ